MESVQFRPGSTSEIDPLRTGAVLSVDLGFSNSSKSTGLAYKLPGSAIRQQNVRFGACLTLLAELLLGHSRAVLILEAPLSGLFSENGNPVARGEFERRSLQSKTGRHWYLGAGAATCLASVFFLRKLESSLKASGRKCEVILYEGFLTFKAKRTDHARDARLLLDSFLGLHECSTITVVPEQGQTVVSVLDVVRSGESDQPAPATIAPAQIQQGNVDLIV